MISCVIFQTAVTIYLFNINKTGDGFEKNLTRILLVLLGHLCTKFFLLVVLKDGVLYGRVATGFGLAYGPLLYISARTFVKSSLSRMRSLAHLIPFFASSLVYLTLIAGGELKIISNNFIINYTSYFQWFVVASLIVYSLSVKKLLHSHKKGLREYTDGSSKIKSKLINNIATVLVAGIVTGIITGIFFELTQLFKSPLRDFHLRVLPYACFAIIPVLILQYKLEQKFAKPLAEIANQMKETLVVPISQAPPMLPAATVVRVELPTTVPAAVVAKRYEKSSLDEPTMDAYERSLNKYVEKTKIFLNTELSLEELALQVKMPKHHLTQLLNDRIKKNFYSYINEYRIQEAITRLKNVKSDVNILSLAYDCGFNSKSSFNNYFKKVTGFTPSAYRKLVETSGSTKGQMTA
jgi:AraC-like DNA-binding protein